MIQRIQTLFLLIIVALHVALYWVPLWDTALQVGSVQFTAYGLRYINVPEKMVFNKTGLIIAVQIINVIAMLLALVAIFLFKNRKVQKRLVRVGMIMEVMMIALSFLAIGNLVDFFGSDGFYKAGLIAIGLNFILFLLSEFRIVHDQRLVESADRLR